MINTNLLKSELLRNGFSYDNLANWLGKSIDAIYRRLSGKTEMSLKEAQIISRKLDLTDEVRAKIFLSDQM